MPVSQPLHMFRWRPKQRRMVTDTWKHCQEQEFIVKGKGMDVLFVFERVGVDPGSKLRKQARIYKPSIFSTPDHLKDITLYVRI
jgi:hypothetical protein